MTKALRLKALAASRQRAQCVQGLPRREGLTDERQDLVQDEHDTDTGHEPGNNAIGCVDDEPANSRQAEEHLHEAGQNDHGERFAKSARVARDDDRHGDGHRRGGSGHQAARTAEDRREEAERDRTVETRGRPHARCNPEAQDDRQRDHHGCCATEEVGAQRLEIVAHAAMFTAVAGFTGVGI